MAIKQDLIDYVRTMVRGEYDENDRLEAKLDAEGWDAFPVLLGVIFYFAVHRRLNEKPSQQEIIQLVAEMRAAAPGDAPSIDANAAEQLVRSAIDPDYDPDIDPEMAGAIQALTVMHVLSQPDVTEQEIDALLAEAVQVANSHLDS